MRHGEKVVAITGIGQSRISRKADDTPLALTLQACLAAIDDAGLSRKDIDGVSTHPGEVADDSGLSPVALPVLQDALRLRLNWHSGGSEGPSQLTSVFNAIAAIAAGLSRHVLVYRTVMESSARRHGAASMFKASGQLSEWTPYGVHAPVTVHAIYAGKYADTYGIRPEQVGQFVVNTRRNAGLNPDAVYRSPITLDDYLASPMISTPLRLFDCDVPVDGSVAFVLSHIDAARDLSNPPIRIEAIGSALSGRNSWSQREILSQEALAAASAMPWARTDLRPADLDFAQVYDGFSYHALVSLEALGICDRGEARNFVADLANIGLSGSLPLNTGGGQLSGGRLHGHSHLHEACVQLWGRGGARQIIRPPRVGLSYTAGGPRGGAILLQRD